jgi:two-component system cell cycle sensor histidine kinase/response regulator CckA
LDFCALTEEDNLELLKILIIDDDPVDCLIFKQCLEAARPGAFVYSEAASGRHGISLLDTFKPDCVLLDFHLPDLDGLQMIRTLQQRNNTLPCAVVMLTGTGSEQIAVEAMKLGVMDYLAKGPESAQALSRTVASAVQRFRLQQQIENQRQTLESRNRELEAIRAQLFEEKERYRVLAEAIPQLVWTADSEGRVHYANQRLWEFSGRETDRSNNTHWSLQSLVHIDDRADLREGWAEAAGSGLPFETELRLHRSSDRSWRWQLMRAVPILASEEGAIRWFGTFTDIEDQKRAEEAARQRQKLESIGLLAGGIAHDFNNLLVGIMGGASFAMDSMERDHPAYPMLEIVTRSSERAAHLTRQLLAYSGKAQAVPEPLDISRMTRKAAEQMRGSIPNNISLIIDTGRHIPPIQADASQMEQLVVNLVMNAAEAIGEDQGIIRVRTAVERLARENCRMNVPVDPLPPGRYIVIEIEDSGSGMDEDTQAQIFDPFFTTKFTGRGLGLAAVHGIVRTLGGGIQVESEIGKGSTFRVMLPLKTAAGETRVVLIICGDQEVCGPAREELNRAGYEVLSAATGSDGLALLATHRDGIDLVILDADRAGWRETFTRLRGLSMQVPVAVLTADPEEAFARGFGSPGMVEIIRKNLALASIGQAVDKILGRAASMTAVGDVGEMDGAAT